MPLNPQRASNPCCPPTPALEGSMDEVSDSDQILHADIRLKWYKWPLPLYAALRSAIPHYHKAHMHCCPLASCSLSFV